jgi:hypothetical protein
MPSRSAIKPGSVGFQFSSCCASALEDGTFEHGEGGKPAKVRLSLFGLDADDRHLQPAAMRLGDGLHRHALLVHRVEDRARLRLLHQAIKPHHVGDMGHLPAIAAVADVRRDTLLARHGQMVRHQAMMLSPSHEHAADSEPSITR